MWNGGLVLILNHVNDIFWKIRHVDCTSYPKLNMNIVYLIPYSVENVKLAAQTLSTTVSKLVSNYESVDTAKFWLMLNKFFDLMNISRATALPCESKPFNAPFSWTDDYGCNFQKSLKTSLDQLKQDQKHVLNLENRKCLWSMPSQKDESLKITLYPAIELKFLIMHKFPYELTEIFC